MSFDAPIARRRGFESALAMASVDIAEASFANGSFTVTGGYEAMSMLIESTRRPTAVFAMSDEMAFGALMAFDEHALVPGVDISIIGVDDHEFAQVVSLTTIRQPVADHGSAAAQMLLDAMTEADHAIVTAAVPDSTGTSTLQPDVSLIVRSTTGPATH